MAWAISAWVATIGAVYVVAQVLGLGQFGGYLGLAGFILGTWFGGVRGGISGRREWAAYALIIVSIAFFTFGLGSCVYAIALYG